MDDQPLFELPANLRIGAATLWQRFHGCDPEYIRDVCHGRCCEAPTRPGGTLITIHRNEAEAIAARGGRIVDGLLVTDGLCTFKTADSLCGLHHTGDKPFGCIASPWTLAPGGRSLVIRNRYRMLGCYSAQAARRGTDVSGWPPAFEAFRSGLDLVLSAPVAADLVEQVRKYGDARAEGYKGPSAYWVTIGTRERDMLLQNDETKHGLREP